MADKYVRTAFILAFLAIAVFTASFLIQRQTPVTYDTTRQVAGVTVRSQIPLENLSQWKDIRLYNSDDSAVIACNLELTSVSPKTVYGLYEVTVEYGPKAISVQPREAFVRGETRDEIQQSCNAFACLITGVDCPQNLFYARGLTESLEELRIVIDANATSSIVAAYTEMLAAMSFLQATRADLDGNGRLDEWELAAKVVEIKPYLNDGGRCVLQPLNNLLQTSGGSNQTIDCESVRGIHIKDSAENKILITNDDKIILSGDQTHLLVESIIVGNVIAPDWIMALRNMR